MAVIEKFLGQCVEIPEDRRYYTKQGLWAKRVDQAVVFGLTQPALVLSGGFKDVDWLVENGQMVNAGEAVVFAITGKILYIDTPISGTVRFNTALRENPGQAATDPYNEGWLYQVQPEGDLDGAYQSLSSAEEYFASLQGSDGLKNPEGIKGGVSGICKAVYTGINQQKI
jgi:glycine cleavage system H lipoate-binding protein